MKLESLPPTLSSILKHVADRLLVKEDRIFFRHIQKVCHEFGQLRDMNLKTLMILIQVDEIRRSMPRQDFVLAITNFADRLFEHVHRVILRKRYLYTMKEIRNGTDAHLLKHDTIMNYLFLVEAHKDFYNV